jgi:hypothetical protein
LAIRENAIRLGAHQEAMAYLTRGLELLETQPDTPAWAQQELDLQLALGPVLMVTRSQAAPEVTPTRRVAWRHMMRSG